MNNIWIQIAVMSTVTYLIRVLPLTLIRKSVTNRFLKSFLYYVPYVTLAVMTFPAMITSSTIPLAGLAAFFLGIIMIWKGCPLFPSAAACCLTVFLLERIL